MNDAIALYKPIGKTPLETIEAYRKKARIPATIPLGYAGRLDPMAEGVLLCLVGEENKKRKEYERLPKAYEVDILFGITTDTYDALGLITDPPRLDASIHRGTLEGVLRSLVGKKKQAYPPYSAARVQGKPLYYWARKGLLGGIPIPTKIIDITSIELSAIKTLAAKTLLNEVDERIGSVRGDFRQTIILATWHSYLDRKPGSFSLATLSITCSSGTYMRSIAHEVGIALGCGAIAYRIVRTSVGPYTTPQR